MNIKEQTNLYGKEVLPFLITVGDEEQSLFYINDDESSRQFTWGIEKGRHQGLQSLDKYVFGGLKSIFPDYLSFVIYPACPKMPGANKTSRAPYAFLQTRRKLPTQSYEGSKSPRQRVYDLKVRIEIPEEEGGFKTGNNLRIQAEFPHSFFDGVSLLHAQNVIFESMASASTMLSREGYYGLVIELEKHVNSNLIPRLRYIAKGLIECPQEEHSKSNGQKKTTLLNMKFKMPPSVYRCSVNQIWNNGEE